MPWWTKGEGKQQFKMMLIHPCSFIHITNYTEIERETFPDTFSIYYWKIILSVWYGAAWFVARHCSCSYLDQTCSFLGVLCFWSDKFDKPDSLHNKNADPLQLKLGSDISLHGLNWRGGKGFSSCDEKTKFRVSEWMLLWTRKSAINLDNYILQVDDLMCSFWTKSLEQQFLVFLNTWYIKITLMHKSWIYILT